MTEADINRVERTLQVTLPSDLRAALLERGVEEFGPFTADLFIQANQRRRKGGILNNITDERWPPQFLYIGGDGTGHTTYFVRCDLNPSGVWKCNHDEVGGIKRVADLDSTSLDMWVE